MDSGQLKTAAEHVGYTTIILSFLGGGIAWLFTRLKKLKEWQVSVMRSNIKDVFNKEILPDVMLKKECDAQHKLTDTNIMTIREVMHNMDQKLDTLLGHILKGLA